MADDLIMPYCVAPKLILTCKQMTQYKRRIAGDLVMLESMTPAFIFNAG